MGTVSRFMAATGSHRALKADSITELGEVSLNPIETVGLSGAGISAVRAAAKVADLVKAAVRAVGIAEVLRADLPGTVPEGVSTR